MDAPLVVALLHRATRWTNLTAGQRQLQRRASKTCFIFSDAGLWRCLVTLSIVARLGATDGDGRLIDAAKSGRRDAVRTLIKAHADVNQTEPDGTTALHWAVRADDVETVRLLLS